MPLVTRTPSISWRGTFISLREQFGHFLVGLRPAVAIKLPDVTDFANDVHIQVGDDQGILVARALFDNLAARIGKVALSVEFAEVPGLFRANAIDGADIEYIGDGRGRLFEFPEIFAEAR